MEVTVFTPAYNRADLMGRLFESLCAQSVRDFEWVIVDDGSTENIEQVVRTFKKEDNGFDIIYIRQPNQGKHIAINNGVLAARGELFFIVDNDDYLSDDAISNVVKEWALISADPRFGGVVFNKRIIGGDALGKPTYQTIDCNPLTFRYRYNHEGDKAEVIRTSIFRKYPFPATKNEKFCPEGLFFNRIKEDLRYINGNIYFCEYLADGLSSQIFKVRKNSPVNTCLYYRELAESRISFKIHVKSMINYYRFRRYAVNKADVPVPVSSTVIRLGTAFLGALIFYLKDCKE